MRQKEDGRIRRPRLAGKKLHSVNLNSAMLDAQVRRGVFSGFAPYWFHTKCSMLCLSRTTIPYSLSSRASYRRKLRRYHLIGTPESD